MQIAGHRGFSGGVPIWPAKAGTRETDDGMEHTSTVQLEVMRIRVQAGLGHGHKSRVVVCRKAAYNVGVYCGGDKVDWEHRGENMMFNGAGSQEGQGVVRRVKSRLETC